MATDLGFQGSSAVFTPTGGGDLTIAPLTKFDYDDSPSVGPITGAGDSTEKVATGMHKESASVGFVGSGVAGIAAKAVGALVVTLNDGTTPCASFGTSVITKLEVSGRLGGVITGSFSFRPHL